MLPLGSYSVTYAAPSAERAYRGGAGALAISGSGTDSSVRDQSQRQSAAAPTSGENGVDLSRQRSSVPFAFLPQIPETPLATYSAGFMAQLLGQDDAADFTAALFGRSESTIGRLFGESDGILFSSLGALAGAANDNLAGFARTQPAKSKPLAKASGVAAYMSSNQRLRDVVRL